MTNLDSHGGALNATSEGSHITHEAVASRVVPWLVSKDGTAPRHWFAARWLMTVWWVLTRPSAVGEQVASHPRATWWRALLFAWMSLSLPILATEATIIIHQVAFRGPWHGTPPSQREILDVLLLSCVEVPIASIGVLSAWAIAANLVLSHGARRGLRSSWQAMMYASAAAIVLSVPMYGIWLVPVALGLLPILGTVLVAGATGANPWRAALAVFAPPIAAFVVLFVRSAWQYEP